MTFFSDVNRDAVTVAPERIATGPRVGFLRAFETSYSTQVRGAALYGIQTAMRDREDKQRQALRDAGVENIPSMSRLADDPWRMFTDFGDDYIRVARHLESDLPPDLRSTDDPQLATRLAEYDERIMELRKQYPDLKLETSVEIWQGVRQEAQEYEERQRYERADFGGAVGGFLGGALGALNPNSDPLNFATLPVGGVGKTAVSRIAGQAGAQGVIETINQITGVQEQRQLLGLDYGFLDAATRVGGAAVGGAAVQGIGEAIGVGFRRLFRATPDDPVPNVPVPQPERAPDVTVPEGVVPQDEALAATLLAQRPQAYYDFMREVSPTGGTRLGRARAAEDLQHVETQLDAWDGPAPWAVPPKTDTATTLNLNAFTRQPDLQGASAQATIDAIARRIDPQTMQRYDKLADEKAQARLQLETAQRDRDASLSVAGTAEQQRLATALAEIDARIARSSAKNRKRLAKERDGLKTQLDAANEALASADTPAMAAVRRRIAEIDERMRDLAEPVSRAYARARGKWQHTEAEHKAVVDMMRDARRDIGPTQDSDAFIDNVQRTLEQDVPMVLERPATVKADADAADIVNAVLDKRAEKIDEAQQTFRSEVARVLSDAEAFDQLDNAGKQAAREKAKAEGTLPPGQYRLEGFDEPVELTDRLSVVDNDGEIRTITIRDLLQQQLDAEEDFKAVQTCSIR